MNQKVLSGLSKIKAFLKNSLVYSTLLVVVALAPIGYYSYNRTMDTTDRDGVVIRFGTQTPRAMEPGAEFNVLACKVIDGHIFQVLLDNNTSTQVRLITATKDEATPAVIEALQTATSPSVVLRRKVGGCWIVDFHVTIQGRRTALLEWLSERKLILD